MAADQPIRASLELDPSADPIAGRVVAEQGADVRFSGWLELISALERLYTPSQQTGEPDEEARDSRRPGRARRGGVR